MALRPVTFSIPSTTELRVTFSQDLSRSLSASNFFVESLSGGDNLEVTQVTIEGNVALVKTRPQVSGNFYLLKFLDTADVIFSSNVGIRLLDDAISRELFFVGIDTINPIRDRMLRSVPKFFQQLENTNLKNILSAQAEEFLSSQRSIGEVLSNNYLCVDVVDEPRTRTAGAVDYFANENAYSIQRISDRQTGDFPRPETLDYTSGNTFERLQTLPVYPISLQERSVDSEEISIDTEGNSFDGFLITVRNRNIIKLLSLTIIRDGEVEDCDGNIGTEYDIERFKYSIKDNFYDQDFAFTFSELNDNQILLSQFGSITRPEILDTIIISYLYKDTGRGIVEDSVEVSRVESIVNESVPTNVTRFFLDHAPVVNINNNVVTKNGIQFRLNENSSEVPDEFQNELIFNISKLPSKLGEYSVNYETGEVYLVGSTVIGEGTGRNNYVASYLYRKEFERDLDYSISSNFDLVATPDRDLANQEAEIFVQYDKIYVEGTDYRVSSHIEVMGESVENRTNQSFSIITKNAPITNVFRIVNQSTGEVYTPIRYSSNEIFFAGNRSPEIKTVEAEGSSFIRVANEDLSVVGEFVIPAFEVTITSNISNNSILFEPGIPAELIDPNSVDYFIREISQDTDIDVEDLQIRFFGNPDGENLINSLGISATATPPSVGAKVDIGTKGFVINLDQNGILNKNVDAIGSILNTSIEFSNKDLFITEKFFKTLESNPGLEPTSSGGISVAFTADGGTDFADNISRLRRVGDYTIDYQNGIVYLAISIDQALDVGHVAYYHNSHKAKNRNIVDASSASKKTVASEELVEASIIYNRLFNDNETIEVLDLESTMVAYDGKTEAIDLDNNRVLIAEIRDDYTVVVPHDIISVNSIVRSSDLVGVNLNSSIEAQRQAEFTYNELITPAKDGGRNLYDVSTVTFEDNVIDLKTKTKRRVYADMNGDLAVTILDSTAETFIEAKIATSGLTLFDQDLNITKVGNLSIVGTSTGIGSSVVSIDASASLATVDTTGDFLLDSNGNRFVITAVDTFLSTLTVTVPAENNVTATEPTLGSGEVVVKPTVTIDADGMTIAIPADAGVSAGSLLEITYLKTLIPDIGTELTIDYRFGFIYFDYIYLADNISVWYEYGNNAIDWSISNALNEGDEYYVSYQYGALREALRSNFGTLTDIPFFQNFSLSIDRELYRNALKGTLQAFPKGPTIPAYTELIKSFTEINPNISELIFGNWILGRDYLCPGKIDYDGVLSFGDGKFEDGLIFNDDVSVSIPAVSSLKINEGTLDAWIRPEWGGINNDADLIFDIDNIGPEKFFLEQNDKPFDKTHNWKMLPAGNIVGGSDYKGPGTTIFNFRTDTSKSSGFDQGVFGLYKNISGLNRGTNASFSSKMKVDLYGLTYNGLSSTNNNGIQSRHDLASFLVPDGYKSSGLHLSLLDVPGTNTFAVSAGDYTSETLTQYDRPHYIRGCGCVITNNVDVLEAFNDLIIEVDLGATPVSLSSFRSFTNILDDDPGIFNIIDESGVVYEVTGFELNSQAILDRIPTSFNKIFIKKFGVNNTSLSQAGSAAINNSLPSGILKFMFKSVNFTAGTAQASINEFQFEDNFALNWTNYHVYAINRDVVQNQITFSIDSTETTMFYTESLDIDSFDMDLNINISDMKGVIIGALDENILSTINILHVRGTFYNRYNLSDIYIGVNGFNPKRIPFTLNRNDFPNTTVGLPANIDTDEGIFIGYDELCQSQVSDQVGQWIFRTRANRVLTVPVTVALIDGVYTTLYEDIKVVHNFSGEITTDGEFFSVVRATRDETDTCTYGKICESSFRFCANELLEEFGWTRLEESDSDLIDTLVGGRETQRGSWVKHGDFTTSTSAGIYRMGPSTDIFSCTEEENFLGNLVYTENPCPQGDGEYLISLKVAQTDPTIAGSSLGAFVGNTSGNLTGIVPLHFNDKDINLKLALAYRDSGEPLVVILDAEQNSIVDIITYIWNDQEFHEYRIVKDDDNSVVFVFIDDLLVSQLALTYFTTPVFNDTSDFIKPSLSVYLFDASLVDSTIFHSTYLSNIVDVDLIFFSGLYEIGNSRLESSDILINTDHRIRFSFNIDALDIDGYADGYTDGYVDLDDLFGVDEIFISADKLRYIVDTGKSKADSRFSIFKDGKGFLNFRIYNDSMGGKNEVGVYNLATNIKHFLPGELHHVAASWRLNTFDEKDEMHLFIDGQEAPNIYKFGGKVPVLFNDKFSDISKEILHSFLVKDIEFCDIYTDGTVSAGNSVFLSRTANFTQDMVGRSIIVTSSDLAPTLVGQEFVIKSVVDSEQVVLGRGSDLDTIEFSVSTSDINFQFPPTAGIKSDILTDLKNSRFAIYRTEFDSTTEEFGGILYTVENGIIDIISGDNVIRPKFRANIDTRIIEFVGEDSDCNFVATVDHTDIDIHVKTFGLNTERCRKDIQLASSSFDNVAGVSAINTHGAEPTSLLDVDITRINLDKTLILVENPTLLPGGNYLSEFSIDLDPTTNIHEPTSKPSQTAKQNRGRLLSLFFDSDNVDFCDFDGYEDGYQGGNLDGEINTITIYGETTDGFNEETYFIDKNGLIPGTKFFTSITRVEGSLAVVDPNYFELGVISIRESDTVTTSNNGGERAEVFDYQNGKFVLTVGGSGGTVPFELHPGSYEIDYPTYLRVKIPEIGHRLFIGSDFNKENQFGGIIDQFRVISEMSSDTRVTELTTSGTRSITNEFNKTIPACQDNQTLALIPFDNPIELQSRSLRNKEFLNTETNFKYTLSLKDREKLLVYANNSVEFISQMINMGFTEAEAIDTYYETHKAEGGPLFNEADYYRNVVEFITSTSSVNDNFGNSGYFNNESGILFKNDTGIFRKNHGTIEFWVSPVIDTAIDKEDRYYVDIFAVKRVRVKSTSSTIIDLPSTASRIHEIRLLEQTKEFSEFYSEDEIDQILFDEVYRSNLTGRLTGGTGTQKDFSAGSKLSADGRKIILSDKLPAEKTDIIITYVPLEAGGDRISIFKNQHSQVVFNITANGIDNLVTATVDWKKNTWHRVMCTYQTNSTNDSMRIFVDGAEGGRIRYGTGIVHGTGFIYGQYAKAVGQLANQDFTISLGDDFRLISIGSDIFGDNSARSRLDNMRFSRIMRRVTRDSSGAFIDTNYSSNLNTVSPVVEDDATTLLVNFDEDGQKINKFATVIDPRNGIFDFDIEVIDNFDKVIGINQGEIESLIVELVNRLKPAHTNALVKFIKSRC